MRGFVTTAVRIFQKNLSENISGSQKHYSRKYSSHSAQIQSLLDKVRERDGLKPVQPHIESLIGGASSTTDSAGNESLSSDSDNTNFAGAGSGGLDIADKTQLILQSAHPVRYIVEREVKKLEKSGPTQVSYHDWVMIFGRSLGVTRDMNRDDFLRFEQRLNTISNAAECGMFSSDVHQTVVNIPADLKSSKTLVQFNMGNKYAVLVGDYFAIRTIFFAEKAKSSAVIIAITNGVEEFTSAPFSSNLIDPNIWYPFIPSPKLTYRDWEDYNIKAPGYFTGGLYAVLTVCPNRLDQDTHFNRKMRSLVPNLNLFLKTLAELNDFEGPEHTMLSPFLFTSLPAILFQEKNPAVFDYFRAKHAQPNSQPSDPLTDDVELNVVRQEIKKSEAMERTKELLQGYARNSKEAMVNIGTDLFYVSVFSRAD